MVERINESPITYIFEEGLSMTMKRLYEVTVIVFILLFGANYAFALSSSPYTTIHIVSLAVSATLGAFFYRFT